MLDFGKIYFKRGIAKNKSPEAHFMVVLGVDQYSQVIYQTLGSGIEKILQYPGKPKPYIDVDTVTFLNYSKYACLSIDTCMTMYYGTSKENKFLFENNIKNGSYKPHGKLSKHNQQSLIVTLKSSTQHGLSVNDKKHIEAHFKKCFVP